MVGKYFDKLSTSQKDVLPTLQNAPVDVVGF